MPRQFGLNATSAATRSAGGSSSDNRGLTALLFALRNRLPVKEFAFPSSKLPVSPASWRGSRRPKREIDDHIQSSPQAKKGRINAQSHI